MYIPNGVIVPLFIASFVSLYYQYYRINPVRRVLNLRFGLMMGAVVLMLTAVFLVDWSLSLIFFVLALVWFVLSLYLLQYLPPREH